MEAFIDDGYTRTVKLNEKNTPLVQYPETVFTYRPLRGAESQVFERSVMFLEAEERQKALQTFVASRLASWSLTMGGQPTKPTAELLGRLRAAHYGTIAAIVLGQAAPDEDLSGNEPAADPELAAKDAKN